MPCRHGVPRRGGRPGRAGAPRVPRVMRSRKFDRNGDDWEGEVVAAHDPGAEPRPFASREDLVALLGA